jgi:hypothetical protein
MGKKLLTNAELDRLADQVDQELKELTADPTLGFQKSSSGKTIPVVPEKQRVTIEKATGESADSFWQKYKQAARKDLCHKDGLLYQQWHKWRDLPSKDAVKVSLGLVAGLGISGAALPVVSVAASVILLNIVLNIGVNAICEDEKQEDNEEAK